MDKIRPNQERFCKDLDEEYTYRILSYIYNDWWSVQILNGSMKDKIYEWHGSSIVKDKVYE